ncbi:MAG: hypothetical protein RhofKO_40690 [Rhodothermales bacterium]
MTFSSPSAQGLVLGVATTLDIAIAEHTPNGHLHLQSPAPAWLTQLWPSADDVLDIAKSYFLTDFVTHAASHWQERPITPLWSEPWTETNIAGHEIVLEAAAFSAGDQSMLLLRRAQATPDQTRHILQESRAQALEMRHLMREVNKREVLLHCIIHDLSTPLASIKGSLTLLRQDQLVEAEGDELLAIALRQTERLQTQIRHVVRDFAQDVKAVLPTLSSDQAPTDLLQVAQDAMQTLQLVAQAASLSLQLDVAGDAPWTTRGDADQLGRVIQNLVDNATRFAPTGSAILIRLTATANEVQVGVLDKGPGVPPQLQPHLFDRFAQGHAGAGAAGLGLFFCRITVERAGGHMGYRDQPDGGACFWFALPRVTR